MCIRDSDVGADDGADLREGQIVRRGGLVGGCFFGGDLVHELHGLHEAPVSYTHLDVYKRQP